MKDQTLTKFSQDLWEKRKEKAIRITMESITLNLKKPNHYFDYFDIVKACRANTYFGDESFSIVNSALARLQLTKDFMPTAF